MVFCWKKCVVEFFFNRWSSSVSSDTTGVAFVLLFDFLALQTHGVRFESFAGGVFNFSFPTASKEKERMLHLGQVQGAVGSWKENLQLVRAMRVPAV